MLSSKFYVNRGRMCADYGHADDHPSPRPFDCTASQTQHDSVFLADILQVSPRLYVEVLLQSANLSMRHCCSGG